MYYTLGQRQGLGIGGVQDAGDAPWYVAAKELDTNTLIVVQGDHPLRYSDALIATDVSWINGVPPDLAGDGAMEVMVKLRYRQPDQACTVSALEDGLRVEFVAPQADVTPGQFAVFYDGPRCLGGAVIDTPIRDRGALLKTG